MTAYAALAGSDPAAYLAELQGGNREAFAHLVSQYHGNLVAIARSMISGGEAEEAVQDAWISAYRNISKFEGRASLKTWLTRIVINECRMRLRKAGREINLDLTGEEQDNLSHRFKQDGHWEQPPVAWDFHTPDEMLEQRDLQKCLQSHMGRMPENQRLVLQLRDLQGLPFDEICNMLEISASNARVLLHRARTALFGMVEHYQETGEC